jgi:PGF-CTERM protein
MVAIDDNGFDALEDGFSASTLATLDSRTGEGVNLVVEADDATGNQDATSLNLGSSSVDNQDIFVLVDNDGGQMFLIVDTSSSDAFDGTVEDGMQFTAELEYETDAEDRFEFNGSRVTGGAAGDGTEAAFPYLQADSTESADTEFTIADADASFDNLNSDDQVQIANTAEATVSGETNLAPGSDASIRVRSASGVSPSFVKTVNTEIADDGSFNATFDFSEQSVDDEGEVTLRVGGSAYGTTDAVIVEQVSDDTATPEPDTATPEPDTATPEPDTATPEPDDDTATPEPDTDTPTESNTGTPGFGVVVALTALIAAALLAVRRDN